MNRKLRWPARCATLSTLPVTRLSMAMTLWPRSNSRSTRCEPRNPAPPVTTDVGCCFPDLPFFVLPILRDKALRVSSRAVGLAPKGSASLGARSEQNNGNRPAENLQVKPQRPVIDVFQIQPHPVAKVLHIVSAADLPETGDTGFDAQSSAVRQIVKPLDLIQGERTRADQAHLTAQDIDQLGKLVETEFANELPNSCHAG